MNNTISSFPIFRPRRLRKSAVLRHLVQETQITVNDLVLPLFIKAGQGIKNPIASLPGHFQLSIDQLDDEVESIVDLKIPAVILFGIPEGKDATGCTALHDHGVIPQAIQKIKQLAPDLLVISDLCFCEYTDHGHCGVIDHNTQQVDNDKTLDLLAQQAVVHAKAGADIIAPSGMTDGMVQAIRKGLDAAHFTDIPILSYAVKYASGFYGPFREAAEGAPAFGDRASYQMDPANANESLKEAMLDVEEGADMLMVKPTQSYLDIVYRVKEKYPHLPLGAYQVSGTYAMIKAAAQKGWIDEQAVMVESLLSIKRAGADFIITYFAKQMADKINTDTCAPRY